MTLHPVHSPSTHIVSPNQKRFYRRRRTIWAMSMVRGHCMYRDKVECKAVFLLLSLLVCVFVFRLSILHKISHLQMKVITVSGSV